MVGLQLLLSGLLAAAHGEPWRLHSSTASLTSVLWHHHRGFSIQQGDSPSKHKVGLASYSNEVNTTGWAFLEVETKETFPDKIQAFAAGYVEGWVTSSLLYMQYLNTVVGRCDGKEELCGRIQHWVDANTRWVEASVRGKKHRSPYWHQVGLFYTQLHGLYAGFQAAVKDGPGKEVTYTDLLTMNIFGDLEDLEGAFSDPSSWVPSTVRGLGRCSALVRLLPGNSDLLVSHDTWNSYQSMLRVLKSYSLPYHTRHGGDQVVAGRQLTFSGYPGVIYSGDDFTLTSSGLTVLETTIGNSNPELWQFLSHNTVLEGVRSMVATRLASDGEGWTEVFARENSGTYNNQWMVVDYKLFVPGEELQPGTFWVLEQLPGYVERGDVTEVLANRTFWPSYNSPYFPDVFNMSGNWDLMEKLGDWFSYSRTPRAQIFARDAPGVADMEGMIKLMRYNNYTLDPLSACNCTPPYSAENGISARCDLNPRNGSYPFGALGHRSHGGTDMKVTSSSLALALEFVAQSGPTWDPLPPFRWSDQDFKDTPHVGHPDLWQFPPLQHTWSMLGLRGSPATGA